MIAESIVKKSSLPETLKSSLSNFAKQTRDWALNPDKEFKNLKSLSQIEQDFLTYWNESSGEEVELFWKEVDSAAIDIERKDILKEVLKRKMIRNILEFNYIIDAFVISQQQGRITFEEANILNSYLAEFEKKNARS